MVATMAKAKGWGSVKADSRALLGNASFVRDFVIAQVEYIPEMFGPDLRDAGDLWIFCPFHDREHIHLATKTSRKINLTDENYAIGHGYCFSCGASKKWNEIADELGVKKLKVNELYQDHMISVGDQDRAALGLMPEPSSGKKTYETAKESTEKDDLLIASIPWKPKQDWRTISGQLIADLGARLWVNDRTLEMQMYMPVYVEGQYLGGIKCLLEKKEGVLSYVNTPGKWSSKALFPYDYVKKTFVRKVKRLRKKGKKKKNVIFIVEGPRDALWLVQHGIPALAFLGSSTKFSDYAGNLVMDLEPDLIIIAFDADAPGRKAAKKAVKFFQGKVDFKLLKMKEGSDPAQLKPKTLDNIKRKLGL